MCSAEQNLNFVAKTQDLEFSFNARTKFAECGWRGKATEAADIKKVGNLPSELCGLTVMHGIWGMRH